LASFRQKYQWAGGRLLDPRELTRHPQQLELVLQQGADPLVQLGDGQDGGGWLEEVTHGTRNGNGR
jgi:hypothetical protein